MGDLTSIKIDRKGLTIRSCRDSSVLELFEEEIDSNSEMIEDARELEVVSVSVVEVSGVL